MGTKQIATAIVGVLVLLIIYKAKQPVTLGDGVMAADVPYQKPINDPISFEHANFEVTPLADFNIKAKVILKEDYRYDKGAEISPTDLALGWGRMSDESVLQQIEFWQTGRWYRYRYDKAPIPQQEIQTHSANMHLIPSSSYIAKQIKKIKAGQIVELQGKLVKVRNKESNWRWKSSLTREDTGDGACELIYVEQLHLVEG
ncbi:hypothetical protein [Kangiella sp. TOML190]|uniref:hypothetical protein n=1 Tax=Kangiella sp. TOML190 TaxID=2931351 RepID=UPI002041564F|nr:hypothetical protein [Kangiella sp. TOML190]